MTDLKVVPDTQSTEETDTPTGQDRHCYTVNEFAERWRLGTDWVNKLIDDGKLPAILIGPRGKRILHTGEQQWLDNHTIDAREPWSEEKTNGS